jgi:hypothetical protein
MRPEKGMTKQKPENMSIGKFDILATYTYEGLPWRLVKIPPTWGAKIGSGQLRERVADRLDRE